MKYINNINSYINARTLLKWKCAEYINKLQDKIDIINVILGFNIYLEKIVAFINWLILISWYIWEICNFNYISDDCSQMISRLFFKYLKWWLKWFIYII